MALSNVISRARCRLVEKSSNLFSVFEFSSIRSRRDFRTGDPNEKNVKFCLSDIGEGIREVTVKNWHVKVNDRVLQFDNICDVESDKATVSITSRYDGVVTRLYYEVDEKAFVGNPLVDIELEENPAEESGEGISKEEDPDAKEELQRRLTETDDNIVESASNPQEKVSGEEEEYDEEDIKRILANKSLATPAVRRIAMENKINIKDVKATGKNNRVLKEDILAYLENKSTTKTISKPLQQPISSCVTKPISGIMKTMVKTMTNSNTIPTFNYSEEFDFSRLVELKSKIYDLTNIKITYLPFIMKAFSNGLKEYPILNSSVDDNCENIALKSFHNIGIAVDTPSGLVVPNVKNVERLSVIEVSKEVQRLQENGIKGLLTPQDLTGGTISISNIGALGGIQGIPLILPPEVAIAAVGKIQKLPRFDSRDQVVKAHIVNITFTADHRIIDGATVSRFSSLVKKYLENPELIMLGI